MAIRDLLWACPVCGREAALRPVRGAEACEACGVRFRRARGAAISAESADGRVRTHTAEEWLRRLPSLEETVFHEPPRQAPSSSLVGTPAAAAAAVGAEPVPPGAAAAPTPGAGESLIRSAEVIARFAAGETVIRRGSRFLGRAERFGPPLPCLLELRPDRITLRPEHGLLHDWGMGRLTAVQPSSSSLQLKVRDEPVVSLRFPRTSVRFWEELLQAAVRRWYRRYGRGEILEFQPRIVTRAPTH